MAQIIQAVFYLLAFLVPVVFTTFSYELFEFPKFILLLSGSFIIALAWIIHAITKGDWQIRSLETKSNKLIFFSIILIFLTQLIATIFSIHPYTSFWGYYSRFHQGMLTTICYTIIYLAGIKWLNQKSIQKIIKISIITSFLISLYAILERLGIDKNLWIQDVQNRVFSTLGQPNWLASFLIPNLFLVLFYSLNHKLSAIKLVYLTLLSALLFTKSRSGLIAYFVSYFFYWGLTARALSWKKIASPAITFTLLTLLLISLLGSAYTPSIFALTRHDVPAPQSAVTGTQLDSGGTESGDIRKIVWSGALRLIKNHPLLGTGPETFAYTYYWERPELHNYTSEWDFLYNKAHNEYLNIAATTGLLGLAAYLFWHLALALFALSPTAPTKKARQTREIYLRTFKPVIFASVISFTITNFFGFSVIPVFLQLIMFSSFTMYQEEKASPPSKFSFWLIPLALTIVWPARLFLADKYFAKGKAYLGIGDPEQAILLINRAVSLRPSEDLYHSYLAESYGELATRSNDPSDIEKAIKEASFTREHNPYHLNYFKSRAKVFLSLASLDPQYNSFASEELIRARQLAPTDPKLAYNLGLVYSRLGNLDKAETQMRQAIELKKDYADAYYALVLLLEQSDNKSDIPPILELAKSNLATYSSTLKDKMDLYLP
ncbi:MAG: hypothetical protein UY18_C0037G0005 [Microgenomates group bacterium GW2011_GWF2_47_9]|nr:MAG: hypothetical protein UY18_C0037G0005 [Microgenomates group bacterium GW2011_GWF2_47_9]